MPYISPQDRQRMDETTFRAETPGELNYAITQLVVDYLRRHKPNYATLNEIIGALESAKLEFYSRVVRPYEDTKIQQNGDVYDNHRL